VLSKEVAQGSPVLKECIGSPPTHFFDDFWVDTAAEEGCSPSNSEGMARDARDTRGGPDGVAHFKELVLAEELCVTPSLVFAEEGAGAEGRDLEVMGQSDRRVEWISLVDQEDGGSSEARCFCPGKMNL
jgi:hypothetical protein